MSKSELCFDSLTSGYEQGEGQSLTAALQPGQHLAIFGPSGCGKSSLLKVIAGLLTARSGDICWQGRTLSLGELVWWRTQINYLPQEPVMGGDTLLDVLRLPWILRATTAPTPTEKACVTMLKSLGITHPLSEDANTLSGGERQRLAIARAALLPRPIWLMDEPTSALDRDSRDRLAEFLRHRDIIRVSVSHDPVWNDSADCRFDMGESHE